jgi:DNA (cytosine-5)-methyltransferase 1
VKGIAETENGKFLHMILGEFRCIRYTVSYWVLNAADFGVPQKRFRLFVVGSRKGISVQKPKPTVKKHVSVKEAISDLPELVNGASQHWMAYASPPGSKYARVMREKMKKSPNHFVTKSAPYIVERYKHIPQGGNWENIPPRLMNNYTDRTRCHTGIYHRLQENMPSIVLGNYRKNMLIHPTQHRGLSVREAARLQSFPDWYAFKGSIGFQQQQVGNAVPPLLANAVFGAVLRAADLSG